MNLVAQVAGTLGANHGNIKAEHAWTGQLLTHALRAEGFDAGEDGTGRGTPLVPVAYGGNNTSGPIEVSTALNAHGGPHDRLDFESETFVQSSMQVRRLTPRECERLQGFPDDFTAINWRGKPAADGPRYRALGNSMAVPVLRWILTRIEAHARALELAA